MVIRKALSQTKHSLYIYKVPGSRTGPRGPPAQCKSEGGNMLAEGPYKVEGKDRYHLPSGFLHSCCHSLAVRWRKSWVQHWSEMTGSEK